MISNPPNIQMDEQIEQSNRQRTTSMSAERRIVNQRCGRGWHTLYNRYDRGWLEEKTRRKKRVQMEKERIYRSIAVAGSIA